MATRTLSSFLSDMAMPVARRLNPEAARALLEIRADKATAARVNKLARKCNEGELTAAERMEYEGSVVAGEYLALLQAEARALLARRNGS
jgi:hypothetical protein